MLDLTGFRLMRRVAHGRSRSLACREHHRPRLRKRNKVHHCIRTSAMTRILIQRFQEDDLFSRTGQAFFSFASFLSFFFFFFWNATAYFVQFAIRGYAPGLLIDVRQNVYSSHSDFRTPWICAFSLKTSSRDSKCILHLH